MNEKTIGFGLGTLAAWMIVICICLGMYGCPKYKVWEQRLQGEAELARADSNRKIQTLEAEASKQSASALADAEVIRAEGVAKANKIVAEGLGGPEGYLRYLWIHSMDRGANQIIYVPTETGLPILEANRFKKGN